MLRLLGDAFGHKVIHRTGDIARWILLQARNDQILFVNNATIVERLFAVDDFHQRRFTGAVTAYQADALILFDMQFCVVQQRRVAER